MASTGVHASQLHHSDTGAAGLMYRIHAVAPWTAVPPDLRGCSPAISAKMNASTKPISTETVQTTTATGPVSAEIPPIENSTSAGTPAATKNAPSQLMS